LDVKIGILGFGVEGQSTFRWLMTHALDPDLQVTQIILMDQKEPENTVQWKNLADRHHISLKIIYGEGYMDAIHECAVVIRSAGISPLRPELQEYQQQGGRITSQVEIFLAVWHSQTIGVTGTMGKGSTVSMITHVLEQTGIRVRCGGNIGVPALDLWDEVTSDTVLVLELSSFQLMSLEHTPCVAVVLRTTSEHLDWHKTLEEYHEAKANLVRHQIAEDYCVYCSDNGGSSWIAEKSPAHKARVLITENPGEKVHEECRQDPFTALVDYGDAEALFLEDSVLYLKDCQVDGSFQLENMAAAILAVRSFAALYNKPFKAEPMFAALKTYQALPYRMQQVGRGHGITFFNDSYATRPEAAIAAAKSMQGPYSIILGGSEKYADFSLLAKTLALSSNLVSIQLIGQTAGRLREVLERFRVEPPEGIHDQPHLPPAFDAACNSLHTSGKIPGIVLLSPACASFGLFSNYKERAERFNSLVEEYLNSEG